MTYIISTNSSGDEALFRKVGTLVDPSPEGLIALYAGPGGEGLSVTAIWESKAHSDRFSAEQLLPALQQLAPTAGPPSTMIEFEAFDDVVAGRLP